MAEQTRVITLEITVIDDESKFVPVEQTKEYWQNRLKNADDLHVTVKDFIREENEENE